MKPKDLFPPLTYLLLSGCAWFGSAAKPPQEKSFSVRYALPTVKPVEGTQEVQDKNGVTIAVSSTPFAPQKVIQKEYKQLPTTFVTNGQYDYEVMTVPHYTVSPENVHFKIKVVNNLNQVLRLAGALVRFNVDGKEVALDPKTAGFESLTNAVLTPREQKDFEIAGPKAAELGNDTTVSLLLYGVVTATDEAGNPTKRSNYEWFYKVGKSEVVRDESYAVETVKMRPSEVPRE